MSAVAQQVARVWRLLGRRAAGGAGALSPLLLALALPATTPMVEAPRRLTPVPPVPTVPTVLTDLTDPTDPTFPSQSSLAEAVEAARRSWASQDAAAIVAQSRQLLLQLPGSDSRSAVSRGQAARLLAGLLRRAESVQVRVVAAREVEPGQGYAELVRQYRVAGTGEARQERILLAFRRDPSRGAWELVELRVLQGGG